MSTTNVTRKGHRSWTAEAKLRILEEARETGQTVSEVCRRHQLAVAQFYQWEKQARRGALEALRPQPRGRRAEPAEARLEQEVARLRAAVAELTLESLELKKGPWR